MFDDDGIILEMFSMAVYSRPQYRIGKSLGNNTQSNIHKYACRLARGQTLHTHIQYTIHRRIYRRANKHRANTQTYTDMQTRTNAYTSAQTEREITMGVHLRALGHRNEMSFGKSVFWMLQSETDTAASLLEPIANANSKNPQLFRTENMRRCLHRKHISLLVVTMIHVVLIESLSPLTGSSWNRLVSKQNPLTTNYPYSQKHVGPTLFMCIII